MGKGQTMALLRRMVVVGVGWFAAHGKQGDAETQTRRKGITIPWFAVLFLVVIGFNSLNLFSPAVNDAINTFDTFLLTMAMTALGAETSIDKFKKAGAKPFLLAALLYCWLLGGGYLIAKAL